MLINNLGSLKANLATYMFHQRFAPNYDTAVQNFEAVANRRLRVRPMEAVTDLITVNGVAALPADYLLWRAVKNGTQPYLPELDYVHPAYLPPTVTIAGTPFTHPPIVFTIEGNNLITRPINDGVAWQLHYYQKIPTINGNDINSNWLITEHPDFYLEGTLTELFALGRNAEGAQLHKARRDELLQEIIQLYALTTGATSPAMRTGEYY